MANWTLIASLGFLIFPPLPESININPTSFSPADESLSFSHYRCINHLAVERPRASPLLVSFRIGDCDPYSPCDLILTRCKSLVRDWDLVRVDTLLAIESKAFTTETFLLHHLYAFFTFVRGADKVDGR